MKFILLFIASMIVIAECNAQIDTYNAPPPDMKDKRLIEYHLPKKALKVKVKYTLYDSVLIFKIFGKDCKPALNEACHETQTVEHRFSVAIKDPVTLEEVVIAGAETYYAEISKLGKRGKSYDVTIESTESGLFKGLNSNQESVLPDIIGGVVGTVLNIIPLVKAAGMGFKSTGVKPDDIKVYQQTIESEEIIEIKEGPTNFTAPTFGKNYSSIPVVEINVTKQNTTTGTPSALTYPVSGVVHYSPAFGQVKVFVKNNSGTNEVRVIDQIIVVPQFGRLVATQAPLDKGSKTVAIAIDPNSGILTKYSDKKVSNTKATFDKINSSIKDIGDAVTTLQQDVKNAPANYTQAQIDKLKLENDLIQAQIDNAKKKKEKENVDNNQDIDN